MRKEDQLIDLDLEEIYKISDELYAKAKKEMDDAKKKADTQYPHSRVSF
jgi:hypothetical protein